MAEEAPGRQCVLSEGEKSRCSAGRLTSSLGCVTVVAQRWAGRGLLTEGQFHHGLS